jgi:hypothetical protein
MEVLCYNPGLVYGAEENHDRNSKLIFLERVKSVTATPNGSNPEKAK